MKKQTKIFVLIISLALMLGAMVGVSVAAEDGAAVAVEQPKIVSQSVYYGDQVYLYYAVNNSALTEDQALEVLLYVDDPTVNAEAVAYRAELSDREYTPNPSYPVYKTFGIPAKAIGDTVYAVAHVVGTEVTYDNMVTYSVAEYCMEMLYTTTPSAAKAKLYNALLAYGEAAQEAFAHNTDKYLLSNLAYAYVEGGTLDGTNDRAIIDVTEAKTITPAIDGFAYVNVTSYSADGAATTTKVASGSSVAVTGHTVVTPAGQILTVNDRRAEDGDALVNNNVMTLDFKISYSAIKLANHMNKFDLLDADGNVINSFTIYADNYDKSGLDANARMRVFAEGFLSGGSASPTMSYPLSVRVTYNWTTGEMVVYTNGSAGVSKTFSTLATDAYVNSIRFSDLCSDIDYTVSFERFDIQ